MYFIFYIFLYFIYSFIWYYYFLFYVLCFVIPFIIDYGLSLGLCLFFGSRIISRISMIFIFMLSLALCDICYHWLMIIFFHFLCVVCFGLWVYNPCDMRIIYIIELGFIYSISFLFVFFGILMYVIILSLFYDHCFWDEFFYYPWSMMSFDLNCVCWWEM